MQRHGESTHVRVYFWCVGAVRYDEIKRKCGFWHSILSNSGQRRAETRGCHSIFTTFDSRYVYILFRPEIIDDFEELHRNIFVIEGDAGTDKR